MENTNITLLAGTAMKPKKLTGFTLIEVLIVVAIVGILAAFAYPSYQEQVRKSRRADCAGELVLFANAMERWFTLNGTYATATLGGANPVFQNTCPIDGGTPTYNFGFAAGPTATTFTVQAAPTGPQAGDKCGTLTLTHLGQQGMNGATGGLTAADCW